MTDRRILVVDDEEHLRELVQTCLEDLGDGKPWWQDREKNVYKSYKQNDPTAFC